METTPEEPARDAVRAYGAAALGGRLRRLSDRIDREAKALYEERGVAFEQRWFPVFNCLRSGEPMSVTDLADRLQAVRVDAAAQGRTAKGAASVRSAQRRLPYPLGPIQLDPEAVPAEPRQVGHRTHRCDCLVQADVLEILDV